MTCVAWDGKTLAADKQASIGSIKFKVRKLDETSDWLIGFAGDMNDCQKFLAWFKNNPKSKANEFPFNNSGDDEDYSDFHILMVHRRQKVIHYYNSATKSIPIVIDQPMFAIGNGAEFALGAMVAGKTSEEAVEIACQLCPDCGMGMDKLVLG